MLEESIMNLYGKMRVAFYRRIFTELRERESSLSATEMFSVDIIERLNRPTIGEFADFIGVSFPSVTYKVNSLVEKGYIKRVRSETDRRESYLELTDKYYDYAKLNTGEISKAVARIEAEFSPSEIKTFMDIMSILEDGVDESNE